MAPFGIFLAGLLALSTVDARKNKVQIFKFPNDKCQGHPLGKAIDAKSDKCNSIHGGSISILRGKDRHSKWIDEVNQGKLECFVSLFDGNGCLISKNRTEVSTTISVPKDFGHCTTVKNFSASSSVKFWCIAASHQFTQARDGSLETPVTSYSIGIDGHASASVYTSHTTPARRSLATPVVARAQPDEDEILEPRSKKFNVKGIWMKHPWAGSDICFECWTKKEYTYGKFECHSGPKHPINCGSKPSHVPATTKHFTVATSTVEFYFTTANQFTNTHNVRDPAITQAPSKRSPKKRVIIDHPYVPGARVCAKAKWKHSNKPKAEVRIYDIDELKKCDETAEYINFGSAAVTETSTLYKLVTTTLATRPTWASTPQA